MRFARLVLTCASLVLAIACTAVPDTQTARAFSQAGVDSEARAKLPPWAKDRDAIARDLAEQAAACVVRSDTSHPAFHGCIDWHSAAHGTWTLVAYTAATGDQRYDGMIDTLLDPDLVEAERAFLVSLPKFEMPYGRAWMLRLGLEYERLYRNGRLDALADEAASSLLAFYRANPPDPRRKAYRNASWALINLHDYFAFHGRAAELAEVRAMIRDQLVDAGGAGCRASNELPEFMSVCFNWAWAVSKVLPGEEFCIWMGRFMPPEALLVPIAPRNAHESGLNFSRAWGLWRIHLATGEERYAEAYSDHFQTAYLDPESWRGDYGSVGHWVAQFGMMALQPMFGPEFE